MKRIALGLLALASISSNATQAQDLLQVEADTITFVQATPAVPVLQPQARVIRGDRFIIGVPNTPSHYLGLECETIPPHFRKLLKLDTDAGGLLIRNVIKDSPAERAKLQEGDIILSINDQAIKTVEQLVEKIQANQKEPLKINFRRDAEEQTVEVQAEKRPDAQLDASTNRLPTPQEAHAQWIEQMRKQGFHVQMPATGTFDVIRPAPGMVLSAPTELPGLPDNTSITIKREGNKPAQIEVKQGDKTYSATSDKLADLPLDIRKLVEPMLQNSSFINFGSATGASAFGQAGTIAAPPAVKIEPGNNAAPFNTPHIRIQPLHNSAGPLNPNLQQEMQDLRKQMEDLQKQLQQLQK
jgi:membrane-associated protease RseP (regulator of RpoE activity)